MDGYEKERDDCVVVAEEQQRVRRENFCVDAIHCQRTFNSVMTDGGI